MVSSGCVGGCDDDVVRGCDAASADDCNYVYDDDVTGLSRFMLQCDILQYRQK